MTPGLKVERINSTGFTVLYEPEKSVGPIADIVLVHGLQGHPRNTWTWNSTSGQPVNSIPIEGIPKKHRLKFWSTKHREERNSTGPSKHTDRPTVYWPYHLLHEDCPRSRILTWGYNSSVSNFFHGSANKNHIFAHSRDLFADLKGMRQLCRDRPLVFMGHSLGGIIIKQMLLLSSDSDRELDRKLYESTEAIMFFGTPHKGSDFSDLGETMRRIASAVGFDTAKQNIRALEIDSGMLEECHRRFQQLQSRQNIEIYTFQETHGVTGISYLGLNRKVVADSSSQFTGTENICSLDANHIDMCKYSSREDAGYQRVTGALNSLFDALSRVDRTRVDKPRVENGKGIEKDETEELGRSYLAGLDSLYYPEMNNRHQEIRKAYPGSCAWIFRHESHIKWVNEDRGLLWIKGKPGSGKSTLMKRILESFEKQKALNQVQLYFFFHRRGDSLQYTQVGMLRTILHQLLSQVASVRTKFNTIWEEKKRRQGAKGQGVDWRLEELRDLFSSLLLAAARNGTIRIFIDALDEAGEESAHELLSYFHGLNDEIRTSEACISICFSCRKYPFFASGGSLEICVDDENCKDITAYTVAELKRLLNQDLSQQNSLDILQTDIVSKASGVFLWAFLMIPVVGKQYNDGESLESIRQKLNQVPSDLGHIYEHVLTKVVDAEKRLKTLHLMQWIFLAQRPLSVTELRYAMASDDSSVRLSQYSIKDSKGFIDNDTQMKKLIVSLSGGLAEIKDHGRKDRGPLVQFIHESVNDFLRKDKFRCLNFSFADDLIGQGHYRLCLSCLNYLKLGEVLSLEITPDCKPNSREIQEIKQRFPLIDYATSSFFQHAEEAELGGISLEELLQRFEWPSQKLLQRWIEFYLKLRVYQSLLPRAEITLLHIAASSNLLSLMRALLKNGAEVDQKDDAEQTALYYAARYRCERASNEASVRLLLEHGADVNAQSEIFSNPLSVAASSGNEAVVRLLVEKGGNVNAWNDLRGAPLQAAAQSNSDNAVAIARFLLENGADIDAPGDRFGTPLQAAASQGNEAMVQLLIERRARINGPAGPYGTALQLALSRENEAIVRLLLKKGADVNAEGVEYCGTTLQVAAKFGSATVLRLLLEAGVDVDTKSGRYSTPFQAAKESQRDSKARLPPWLKYIYPTPFQAAKESKRDSEAKMQLLLKYKYGIRWVIRSGIKLDKTAKHGSEAILRLLLRAKVDKPRRRYGTLLQLAKESRTDNKAKVELLLKYKYGFRWLSRYSARTPRKVIAIRSSPNKYRTADAEGSDKPQIPSKDEPRRPQTESIPPNPS